MEPKPDVSGHHPDNLTQYAGTVHGKEAQLSYATGEIDGQQLGSLNARFSDSQKHSLDNDQTVEVYNNEVICVVETQEKAFQINTVSIETADKKKIPERKLAVIEATNLPPEFVKENNISPQFPYLEDPSNSVAREQSPHFYVVISTHSGSRYVSS